MTLGPLHVLDLLLELDFLFDSGFLLDLAQLLAQSLNLPGPPPYPGPPLLVFLLLDSCILPAGLLVLSLLLPPGLLFSRTPSLCTASSSLSAYRISTPIRMSAKVLFNQQRIRAHKTIFSKLFSPVFATFLSLYFLGPDPLLLRCFLFALGLPHGYSDQNVCFRGVSSVPFGIPFHLPVLFYNRSSSQFIICK